MIETILNKMNQNIEQLTYCIDTDMEDIRKAKHENLLDRNDTKLRLMEELASLKEKLNLALMTKMQQGEDINIYRQPVDDLEQSLTKLSNLNAQLGNVVLPLKQMYNKIVDDITKIHGGSVFEVRA